MSIDWIISNPSLQNREDTRDSGRGDPIRIVVLQVPTETVRSTGQEQENPALNPQGIDTTRKGSRRSSRHLTMWGEWRPLRQQATRLGDWRSPSQVFQLYLRTNPENWADSQSTEEVTNNKPPASERSSSGSIMELKLDLGELEDGDNLGRVPQGTQRLR